KFRTPHVSTMLTGGIIAVVAAFTPILVLEEMVNIGTLFAFVVVCAAVLILRNSNPEANRPFRTPAAWLIAPLGIFVNFAMMLFLSVDSWMRLVVWMTIGLVIYLAYGFWHSTLGKEMRGAPVHVAPLPTTGDYAPRPDGEAIQKPGDEIKPAGGEVKPKV